MENEIWNEDDMSVLTEKDLDKDSMGSRLKVTPPNAQEAGGKEGWFKRLSDTLWPSGNAQDSFPPIIACDENLYKDCRKIYDESLQEAARVEKQAYGQTVYTSIALGVYAAFLLVFQARGMVGFLCIAIALTLMAILISAACMRLNDMVYISEADIHDGDLTEPLPGYREHKLAKSFSFYAKTNKRHLTWSSRKLAFAQIFLLAGILFSAIGVTTADLSLPRSVFLPASSDPRVQPLRQDLQKTMQEVEQIKMGQQSFIDKMQASLSEFAMSLATMKVALLGSERNEDIAIMKRKIDFLEKVYQAKKIIKLELGPSVQAGGVTPSEAAAPSPVVIET
jgi:hypothetical protein